MIDPRRCLFAVTLVVGSACAVGSADRSTVDAPAGDSGDSGPTLVATLPVTLADALGDVVIDLSATFPPEADALPEIGYQRALSAEPIAAFEPTVLLATDLAGPAETLDQLRTLGYPLVMIDRPVDASGPATKIRQVAAAAGGRPRVMALYLRGERVQFVFGKDSGLDWVIEAAGAIDVGTELGVVDNAPLTAESVLEAAPDVFLVSTTGLESVGGLDGLLAIPRVAQTPAGEAARVIAHPASTSSAVPKTRPHDPTITTSGADR